MCHKTNKVGLQYRDTTRVDLLQEIAILFIEYFSTTLMLPKVSFEPIFDPRLSLQAFENIEHAHPHITVSVEQNPQWQHAKTIFSTLLNLQAPLEARSLTLRQCGAHLLAQKQCQEQSKMYSESSLIANIKIKLINHFNELYHDFTYEKFNRIDRALKKQKAMLQTHETDIHLCTQTLSELVDSNDSVFEEALENTRLNGVHDLSTRLAEQLCDAYNSIKKIPVHTVCWHTDLICAIAHLAFGLKSFKLTNQRLSCVSTMTCRLDLSTQQAQWEAEIIELKTHSLQSSDLPNIETLLPPIRQLSLVIDEILNLFEASKYAVRQFFENTQKLTEIKHQFYALPERPKETSHNALHAYKIVWLDTQEKIKLVTRKVYEAKDQLLKLSVPLTRKCASEQHHDLLSDALMFFSDIDDTNLYLKNMHSEIKKSHSHLLTGKIQSLYNKIQKQKLQQDMMRAMQTDAGKQKIKKNIGLSDFLILNYLTKHPIRTLLGLSGFGLMLVSAITAVTPGEFLKNIFSAYVVAHHIIYGTSVFLTSAVGSGLCFLSDKKSSDEILAALGIKQSSQAANHEDKIENQQGVK